MALCGMEKMSEAVAAELHPICPYSREKKFGLSAQEAIDLKLLKFHTDMYCVVQRIHVADTSRKTAVFGTY